MGARFLARSRRPRRRRLRRPLSPHPWRRGLARARGLPRARVLIRVFVTYLGASRRYSVQLPDGTRLPARFNSTQTIGDVYDFVMRAHPATQGRSFVVATTFPNKDHTDRELVLGEMAEFKKGGTAVVKWT